MYPFVETIRIEQGSARLLPLHEERLNRTRREALGLADPIALAPAIERAWREYASTLVLPEGPSPASASRPAGGRRADDGRTPIYKCRVLYKAAIERIEFALYTPPLITSLLLAQADDLDYTHKSTDRTRLASLHDLATQRGASDALIVRRGLVTDTTFCNVAFSADGLTWVTPARPLLRGVMREHLLRTGRIVEGDIAADAIRSYRSVRLFNAMNEFGGLEIGVADILKSHL